MPLRKFHAPSLSVSLSLTYATLLAVTPLVSAQGGPISVVVDGRPVNFGGAAPTMTGGRLLVPLRGVFEALGASVDYNASTSTIKADRGSTQLQIALGSPQAIVNGQPRTLDVPPQAVDGRTMVPLRFVAETFGAQVNFNATSQTVTIVSPPGSDGRPAYTAPGASQLVSGTLVKLDTGNPSSLTVSVEGNLRTYSLPANTLVLRQLSVAPNAATRPVRQPARPIALASLVSGTPVTLTLDDTGQITQIMSAATVIVARVQYAAGKQIVLEDETNTTLTLGPNLRFVDARGKASTDATMEPGQSIGLFISPQSRAIYQVSAFAPDIAQNAGPQDTLPPGTSLPGPGTPQVTLVSHTATTPVKAGAKFTVTVRGTAGLRGTFGAGPRVVRQALVEDPGTPGVYTGTYTVRPGDDVLNGRVTAVLENSGGQTATGQSDDSITIDTVPPTLLSTFPLNGTQINVTQPNLAIFADDLNGSGLDTANIEVVNGSGDTTPQRIPATVAPPTSVNAVPPRPLSGRVTVRAAIADKAGNVLNTEFEFFVATGGANNLISSFSHGATRAMLPGEDVPLSMSALPAGKGTYDVLTGKGEVVARNQPLNEVQPGTYRGSFRIPGTSANQLRFVGRFTATDNSTAQAEVTARVNMVAPTTTFALLAPKEGDRIKSPIVVRGQAAPGTLVDVALRAEGTQFFILEYKEELGAQQVKADANGNWQTKAIELPARRNVADLRYVITATPTDAANRQGEPAVVTVRTR